MAIGMGGAIIIGGFAGIVSTLGFIFLSPILYKKIKLDLNSIKKYYYSRII